MRTRPKAFVESWLRRRARTASAALLAQEALAAVWRRAQRALSEIALQSLARAALDSSARAFPLLAHARVTSHGFELGRAADAPSEELLPALGGLLVELIALIEDTSGAILAPALEAELLRVEGGRRAPVGGVRPFAAG
jgi:hypothetical protein